MPKAAVNENQLARLNKDQIWCTENISSMQSVSVTHGVDKAPNGHFRSRIRASHAAHDFAAPISANRVQLVSAPLLWSR